VQNPKLKGTIRITAAGAATYTTGDIWAAAPCSRSGAGRFALALAKAIPAANMQVEIAAIGNVPLLTSWAPSSDTAVDIYTNNAAGAADPQTALIVQVYEKI
jgi:hypothetical protein